MSVREPSLDHRPARSGERAPERATKRLTPLAHGTQNGCFGCGDANPSGLGLRFYVDEDDRILCHFTLEKRFEGPPGYAHGGIIATLLDEAMSKANRHRGVYAMTRHMEVDFLRPVPLGVELVLEGRSASEEGRKHRCDAELREPGGRVLATGRGLFVEVKREKLLHTQTDGR
jgi:uncharacterized protein (TIGR00369 family)